MMKAQRLSLDMISTLPPNIIETILCYVPIQEAARTSILSKEWRYKWTKIPKLLFQENSFEISTDENDENELFVLDQTLDLPTERNHLTKTCKIFNAIYQVLLLHQGPIVEFSLYTKVDDTCVEIDEIILHLSSHNTLKKISIALNSNDNYRLPVSIFSLHQLTHIYLHQCQLDHEPTFNGFRNLTSLFLRCVDISTKTLLHLVSNCPLLNNFTLLIEQESIIGDDRSTFAELFECLPVIAYLSIWHPTIECFAQDGVPQVLPTALVHLKYFSFGDFCFFDEHGLPFLGLVLRSSPNLEKLNLSIYPDVDPPIEKSEIDSFTLEGYSDIWLEHLYEFEIIYFGKLKAEMEFVKLILARSPVLKKVHLFLDNEICPDEEILILRNLVRAPRASPLAEIIFERSIDGSN